MKTNKRLIILLFFLLLGFACSHYIDDLERTTHNADDLSPENQIEVQTPIENENYSTGGMN